MCSIKHGSLNVPIEHHPTIRYMVYNGYYRWCPIYPKWDSYQPPLKVRWIGVFNLLSKSTCELAILLLTWLFLLVNVPILRKLSNLLSGQWTSLHCNFASFRLALRLSSCPGNMDFGTHRRLTKKPMPLGTPGQIGLPRRLTNQSEDGIWISRTGLYPKIPIAMVKMGSKIHGFYTPYFQTHPGGEHVNKYNSHEGPQSQVSQCLVRNSYPFVIEGLRGRDCCRRYQITSHCKLETYRSHLGTLKIDGSDIEHVHP